MMRKSPLRKMSPSRDKAFGSTGSAAQRQAIDSFSAIANVTVDPADGKPEVHLKDDEAAIVKLLRKHAGKPAMSISKVAEAMKWPATRTAEALTGVRAAGLLKFVSGPDQTTLVELIEQKS
jgi:hypothetical protein